MFPLHVTELFAPSSKPFCVTILVKVKPRDSCSTYYMLTLKVIVFTAREKSKASFGVIELIV